MKKKKTYIGYIVLTSFGNLSIPSSIQNLLYRNYTEKKSFNYKLPPSEFAFNECYMQLFDIVNNQRNIDGILFLNFDQLPKDNNVRKKIYKKFLARKLEAHFILNDLIFKDKNGFDELETKLSLEKILNNCPKTIPESLIQDLKEWRIC